MSLDLSPLSGLDIQTSFSLSRNILLLCGHPEWHGNSVSQLLGDKAKSSVWVGEQPANGFDSISFKKARNWLGSEKAAVIFDAYKNFDADAFAAINGIVVGGGLFILLMPPVEDWQAVYASLFGQRFIKSINQTAAIHILNETDSVEVQQQALNFNTETIKHDGHVKHAAYLTVDQKQTVEAINKQLLSGKHQPVVLHSDRGRGKSAALGMIAAKQIQQGIKNIIITAPRLRATEIIFKHAAQLLPAAELSRGKLTCNESIIQFIPPDQLMQQQFDCELLLIDEAASIPLKLLTIFLKKYPQCIFSSTVHGYEGTGRGFTLRFNKVLDKNTPGWKKYQMQTPIRWPENDPLEQWMFSLLCLDVDLVGKQSLAQVEVDKLEKRILNKKELVDDEALLREVFSLLILAHYRTRPGDLQRMLDDENLSLYVAMFKHHVLAIALVNREGNFSPELSTAVYRGVRRPGGHLLAQALTYHCGVEQAAILDYSRIMRIAVHPEFQNIKIGTQFIQTIIKSERELGRDAIGTSYGLNISLLRFWKRPGFKVVRIGFTHEQTSGEHAAIMLMPFTSRAKKIFQEAITRFNAQIHFWFEGVLSDLGGELKSAFPDNNIADDSYLDYSNKDLYSYIYYSRNYELCIAAVNKLVRDKRSATRQAEFPQDYRKIVELKINQQFDWDKVVAKMNLKGKREARELLQKAIIYLYEQ